MYTYEKIISKCYLPLHILCKEINKRRNKREELNKKSNIVHPPMNSRKVHLPILR